MIGGVRLIKTNWPQFSQRYCTRGPFVWSQTSSASDGIQSVERASRILTHRSQKNKVNNLCLATVSVQVTWGTTTTVLRPFFRDHPGEPVPEEYFWTLWCKGRLTKADTPIIRLGATPSGLSSAHVHHLPFLQYLCWQGALNSNTNQPTWTDCFTARRSYASAVLGVVILSVRPPVHPSVRLSVTRVLCD